MKKAVIFDMDGVLVDNTCIHMEAFEIFGERHGLEVSREKLLFTFGKKNAQIFEVMYGKGTFTDEQLVAMGLEKEEVYREIFEKRIAPANGLVDFLKSLKERGVKVAVGSSGSIDNVRFVLNRCGIEQYFDAIAHGDIITKGKPDPEVFLMAADMLGEKPEDCVVIEDALVGIEAARSAGTAVVAMDTTFPKDMLSDYDVLIHDFTEIDVDTVLNL